MIQNKTNYRLGINTGFALNRYPLPEQWLEIIGNKLGLRYVQLTADLINPSLGSEIIDDYIERINYNRSLYNVEIDSVMTGAFTRINHFSFPDKKVRTFWVNWFKKLIDIAVAIGANNVSSHLGIMCYEDLQDINKRRDIFDQTVDCWKEIATYGKKCGLKYLSWEPMSIAREYGENQAETKRIIEALEGSDIPIKLCLDVDHGDLCSTNPIDTDPYSWLENFIDYSPLVHIKQSLIDKGGHYPFIKEYNEKGKIIPDKIIQCLDDNSADKETLLLLELSFREREPVDSTVLDQLIESTNYWRDSIVR